MLRSELSDAYLTHPHLKDKKAKARRGQVIGPSSPRWSPAASAVEPRPSAPAQTLRAGSPAWSLCPGSWMGGAGCSQETELDVLHIPLKTRAGTGSLRQSPARAGPRAGEGTGRKRGCVASNSGPERATDGSRPPALLSWARLLNTQ